MVRLVCSTLDFCSRYAIKNVRKKTTNAEYVRDDPVQNTNKLRNRLQMNHITFFKYRALTLGLLVNPSMLFSSIIGPANICIPRSKVAGHGRSNSFLKSFSSELREESRECRVSEPVAEVSEGRRGDASVDCWASRSVVVMILVRLGWLFI